DRCRIHGGCTADRSAIPAAAAACSVAILARGKPAAAGISFGSKLVGFSAAADLESPITSLCRRRRVFVRLQSFPMSRFWEKMLLKQRRALRCLELGSVHAPISP